MFDLVLREETLANERRSPLTPEHLAKLTDLGYKIALCDWAERAYTTAQYVKAVKENGNQENFEVIRSGTWKTDQRCSNAIILGIKEIEPVGLTSSAFSLHNTFIHFDHSYKGQSSWAERLMRFASFKEDNDNSLLNYKGSSATLLDHEYMLNKNGQRTHAFGLSAGYASAAISTILWAKNILGKEPALDQYYFDSKQSFFNSHLEEIKAALEIYGSPKALLIGGEAGRSVRGALKFFSDLNTNLTNKVELTRWGRVETNQRQTDSGLNGIEQYDIILNCIFTNKKGQPFITDEKLKDFKNICQIGDITCDNNELNRLPLSKYETNDFDKAYIKITPKIGLMAIDHTPAFFPREASKDFSNQFFPHLKSLMDLKVSDRAIKKNSPWGKTLEKFENSMEVPTLAYRIGNQYAGLPALEVPGKIRYIKESIVQTIGMLPPLTTGEEAGFLKFVAMGIANVGLDKKSSEEELNKKVQSVHNALGNKINGINMCAINQFDARVTSQRNLSSQLEALAQNKEFKEKVGSVETAIYQKKEHNGLMAQFGKYINLLRDKIIYGPMFDDDSKLEKSKRAIESSLKHSSASPELIGKITSLSEFRLTRY